MKQIDESLPNILKLHQLWLDTRMTQGRKADLRGAELSGANLAGAELSGANLSFSHLKRVDLTRANLSGAILSHGELTGADLTGADLTGADLSFAGLTRANLNEADLCNTNLLGAHLGTLRVIQIGPIGSRKSYLTYKWGLIGESQLPIDEAMTGCFKGTLNELAAAVQKTHGDNEYGIAYQKAIRFITDLRSGAVI